jgi:hypothetical protein
LLDILGRADIFGLAAQGLADIGAALEPLAEPTAELAEALSGALSVGIESVAKQLAGIATVTAPVVEGLAAIVDAIPPDWIAQATVGFVGLAGAVKALQLTSAVTGLAGFAGAAGSAADASKRLAGFTKDLAGKAVGIGAVAAAAAVGVAALFEWTDSLKKLDENARRAAAGSGTLSDAMDQVFKDAGGFTAATGGFFDSFTRSTVDATEALEQLVRVQAKGEFARWAGDLAAVDRESAKLAEGLNNIDEAISGLPLEDATSQFARYAKSVGATDEQILAMLDEMPLLKARLEDVSAANGQVASDSDLVAAAMGGATEAAYGNSTALDAVTVSAESSAEQIKALSDTIREFQDKNLTARDSAREYEAAIDDLTESVKENGTELRISEEAGRLNEAALDALAQATKDLAADTLLQTGNQADANQKIREGRDELIRQLGQFGITGQAAEDYANKLGLIPQNIVTKVALDSAAAQAGIDRFVQTNNGRTIRIFVDGSFDTGSGTIRGYASGGTLYGPQTILAGEAGPEAIVPLNRPLDQVDESVRWLSAIAQGKTAMASGGTVGSGRQVTVASGAIVVEDRSGDSRRTGNEVLTRLIERIQ